MEAHREKWKNAKVGGWGEAQGLFSSIRGLDAPTCKHVKSKKISYLLQLENQTGETAEQVDKATLGWGGWKKRKGGKEYLWLRRRAERK